MECIQCIGLALVPPPAAAPSPWSGAAASGSCEASHGAPVRFQQRREGTTGEQRKSRAAARALIPGRVLRIGGRSGENSRRPAAVPQIPVQLPAGPCDFSPPPLACPRPAVGSRRAAPARAALHGRAGSRLRQLRPPRGREQPPAPGRVHSLQQAVYRVYSVYGVYLVYGVYSVYRPRAGSASGSCALPVVGSSSLRLL